MSYNPNSLFNRLVTVAADTMVLLLVCVGVLLLIQFVESM